MLPKTFSFCLAGKQHQQQNTASRRFLICRRKIQQRSTYRVVVILTLASVALGVPAATCSVAVAHSEENGFLPLAIEKERKKKRRSVDDWFLVVFFSLLFFSRCNRVLPVARVDAFEQ